MAPDVARGSIKDFGSKVVKNARVEFVAHLDTADIDEIGSLILAKASDRFLDDALEARLRTIDAKPLINALARAERLGYEPDDIVEEPVGGQERVIPQNVPEPPPPMPGQAAPPKKQCRMCNRVFDKEPPYVYVSCLQAVSCVCLWSLFGMNTNSSCSVACRKSSLYAEARRPRRVFIFMLKLRPRFRKYLWSEICKQHHPPWLCSTTQYERCSDLDTNSTTPLALARNMRHQRTALQHQSLRYSSHRSRRLQCR